MKTRILNVVACMIVGAFCLVWLAALVVVASNWRAFASTLLVVAVLAWASVRVADLLARRRP